MITNTQHPHIIIIKYIKNRHGHPICLRRVTSNLLMIYQSYVMLAQSEVG